MEWSWWSKKILKDTLNLTSINLRKTIYLELFHTLELQKKLLLNKDRVRLDYLKEQSAIAKELNIADNQINNVNLTQQSNVSLSINIADIVYYLRGYRAIDKEIELIENREYQEIAFIQQEFDDLIKQNIKWVYYNIQSMEVKLLNVNELNLAILIVLGLVVGIFYVLITHAFQSKKTLKKNN